MRKAESSSAGWYGDKNGLRKQLDVSRSLGNPLAPRIVLVTGMISWSRLRVETRSGRREALVAIAPRKVVRSSIVLTLWLVVAAASLSPARAGLDQDGRETGSSHVDGSFARLQGDSYHPSSNQCVLYSTLSYDSTAGRQVESGLVRCSGASIDGTCPSGQVFVERFNGSAYFCTPGYSFDNFYQYDATTYRNSSTSTTFTGHINGASLTQGGFGLSDNIHGWAWGEATGGTTCPSSISGSIVDWEKYDTSAGWTYVTSSDVYRYSSSMSGAPCWSTTTSTGSKGNFDVHD